MRCRQSRQSKYRAKKSEYRGEIFDSGAEAAYAKYLDNHDESAVTGPVLFIMRQPKFTLGCPENVYRPDFLVITPRYVIAVDIKGHETQKFRKDRKLWAKYGPCPLQVVRLKLRYPRADPEAMGPAPLPTIRGIEFDIIPGGHDRRVYGPLHPDWLINPGDGKVIAC